MSLFKEIEQAAAQIHTMRDFHENNEITYANGGCRFNDVSNFRKTRLVDAATFEAALTLFVKTMRECLNKPTQWLGQTARLYQILDPLAENFLPFAQKLHLKTGDTFMCKPDLHGDVHSLIACHSPTQSIGVYKP